jgi:hypothetical protein
VVVIPLRRDEYAGWFETVVVLPQACFRMLLVIAEDDLFLGEAVSLPWRHPECHLSLGVMGSR